MSAYPSRRRKGHHKINAADIRKGAETVGKVADIGGTILSFIPGVGPAVNAALQVGAGAAKAAAKVAGKAEAAEAAGKKMLAKHRNRRAKAGLRKAGSKTEAAAKKSGIKLDKMAVARAHLHNLRAVDSEGNPVGPSSTREAAEAEDVGAGLADTAAPSKGMSGKMKAGLAAVAAVVLYKLTRGGR